VRTRHRHTLFVFAECSNIVFTGNPGIGIDEAIGRPNSSVAAITLEKMKDPASNSIIEILTIDLKPGRRDEFHKLYVSEALPLLKKWNFEVLAYGPSLHDVNSYYVIRRFKSLEDRQKSEDAYYSSDDWQKGPRSTILALVDDFAYAVLSAKTLKEITGTPDDQE